MKTVITLTVLACVGISFLITAGIFWLICWAFALTFTWKIALGVWLVLCLLKGIHSVTIKKKRRQ